MLLSWQTEHSQLTEIVTGLPAASTTPCSQVQSQFQTRENWTQSGDKAGLMGWSGKDLDYRLPMVIQFNVCVQIRRVGQTLPVLVISIEVCCKVIRLNGGLSMTRGPHTRVCLEEKPLGPGIEGFIQPVTVSSMKVGCSGSATFVIS